MKFVDERGELNIAKIIATAVVSPLLKARRQP